jgi:hypothetical protein
MIASAGDQKLTLFPTSTLQIVGSGGDQEVLVSTANLVIALESEMARIFGAKPAQETSQLEHERACYVHALKAISVFFKRLGIQAYDRRFYRLALALDDLSRGRVDPLLGGEKPAGAEPS